MFLLVPWLSWQFTYFSSLFCGYNALGFFSSLAGVVCVFPKRHGFIFFCWTKMKIFFWRIWVLPKCWWDSKDFHSIFFPILWKSKGYIFFYPYLLLCSAEEYICNEVIFILGWAIHLTNNTNIYWSSSNHSQCRK